VCHYLYNLTLTEPRFLKRTASSLAAAILTLTKMLLCSFSACDVSEIKFIIHDKSLFRSEHFMETLIDLWNVFTSSITNRELFRVSDFPFIWKVICFFRNLNSECSFLVSKEKVFWREIQLLVLVHRTTRSRFCSSALFRASVDYKNVRMAIRATNDATQTNLVWQSSTCQFEFYPIFLELF